MSFSLMRQIRRAFGPRRLRHKAQSTNPSSSAKISIIRRIYSSFWGAQGPRQSYLFNLVAPKGGLGARKLFYFCKKSAWLSIFFSSLALSERFLEQLFYKIAKNWSLGGIFAVFVPDFRHFLTFSQGFS